MVIFVLMIVLVLMLMLVIMMVIISIFTWMNLNFFLWFIINISIDIDNFLLGNIDTNNFTQINDLLNNRLQDLFLLQII